jgi:hypothetical protein
MKIADQTFEYNKGVEGIMSGLDNLDITWKPKLPLSFYQELYAQKSREVVYLKTAIYYMRELIQYPGELANVSEYAVRMSYMETVESRSPTSWSFN